MTRPKTSNDVIGICGTRQQMSMTLGNSFRVLKRNQHFRPKYYRVDINRLQKNLTKDNSTESLLAHSKSTNGSDSSENSTI